MLGARTRANICGNVHARLHVNRTSNGATVRGPCFVDFYVISSLLTILDDTVPIGISCCFDSPMMVFPFNLGPIE